MKRILLYIAGENGCTLHRLILPHAFMNTEEFTIQFGTNKHGDELIEEIGNYDAFVYHRILPKGMIELIRLKYPNLKIICDVDDTWNLTSSHIMYEHYQRYGISEDIRKHIELSDYVTCTTPMLADKIKPHNPNVYIFPNALVPDSQFKPNPTPSDKVRIGIIGGCAHVTDMQILDGMVRQLPKDVLENVQFVLGGFDKGTYHTKQSDGTIKSEPMPWDKVVWTKMEKIITDNYNIVSPEYKELLQRYLYKVDTPSDEPYRRLWTKDIWNYATLYDEIDVLLVPLIDSDFNRYKSELKMIEASVKGKAVIVPDVYPYKYCAIPYIEYGGKVNPEGNCLMVNNRKGSSGWAKEITRIVRNKAIRDTISDNLRKLTADGAKYNLRKVSADRLKWYKETVFKYEKE